MALAPVMVHRGPPVHSDIETIVADSWETPPVDCRGFNHGAVVFLGGGIGNGGQGLEGGGASFPLS